MAVTSIAADQAGSAPTFRRIAAPFLRERERSSDLRARHWPRGPVFGCENDVPYHLFVVDNMNLDFRSLLFSDVLT